jgi:SAM-dependent methyltransferase
MYDTKYFDKQVSSAATSAARILPIVLEILEPDSIVDLGCGRGAWLKVASHLGVTRLVGIDGPWVTSADLMIDASCFRPTDFTKEAIPDLERRFDLAICCEVLEHVSPEIARTMIDWLCRNSRAVLFSAAIPGQGGRNHINEDWMSNWVGLFSARNFDAYDIIRPRVWSDQDVADFYRQNCILAAERGHPSFSGMTPVSGQGLDRVHPELFSRRMNKYRRMYRHSVEGIWKRLTAGMRR